MGTTQPPSNSPAQAQTTPGSVISPSAHTHLHDNSNASTPSSSTSSSKAPVPRVGGVRCYWALVTPRFPVPGMNGSKLELKFVHPDPVLSVHLARQQMTLVGHDMLEFIHPSERDQARKDLEEAIAIDDLQGSVTRVRFARLSRIREILGGTKDEIEYPTDANKFVEDDEYLILDLVLGWVSDGVLLAFFHAIKDKDAVSNNDFSKRHEEWSNYCGTAHMAEEQIEALHGDITQHVPFRPTAHPPTRVFQLYTTAEAPTRPDQLLFSWPPPRPIEQSPQQDGQYYAEDYTALMRTVAMDAASQASPGTKTNCQARYAATHTLNTEGVYRVVSSVYIPYGTLIFACYQTVKQVEPQPSRSASMSVDGSPPESDSIPTNSEAVSMAASSSTSPSYQNWNPASPHRTLGHSTSSSGYTGSSNALASSSSSGYPGHMTGSSMATSPSKLSNERTEIPQGSTPPPVPQYIPQTETMTLHAAPPLGNGHHPLDHPRPHHPMEHPQHPQHGPLSVDDLMDGSQSSASHYAPPPLHPHPYPNEEPYYSRPPDPYGPPHHTHAHLPHLPRSFEPQRPFDPPRPFEPPHPREHPYQDYPPPPPPPDPHGYPRHEHQPPYYHQPPHQDPHTHYDGYPPLSRMPLQRSNPMQHQHQHHPYHSDPYHPHPHPQSHYPGPMHELEDEGYRRSISGPYRSPENWTSELPRDPHARAAGPSGNPGGRYDGPHPSGTTRPLIPPPAGVPRCIACGTEESPEWRKSTTGIKELCNACGLRHARLVAKRDGKKRQPRPPVDQQK